jgi:hypothetical protein
VTDLSELTGRLERAARRLREGGLPAEEAAALVEECARLAGEAATELDRQGRAVAAEPLPGQDRLL